MSKGFDASMEVGQLTMGVEVNSKVWDTGIVTEIKPFDPVRDIQEFHEKFGLEYNGKPRALREDLASFRSKFAQEEVDELKEAFKEIQEGINNGDDEAVRDALAKSLDAIVDECYVAIGTAYTMGLDFKEAWNRVHAANMAKVRAERASDSKRGSTFDVVKPEGWVAPNHDDLVKDFEVME